MSGVEVYWLMAALVAGWAWTHVQAQSRRTGSWRLVWELMRLQSQVDGTDPLRAAPRSERSAFACLLALVALSGLL